MNETVNKSWTTFLESLGDDLESSFDKLPCAIEEFFDQQKFIDKARKDLKRKEIEKILKLYLTRLDLLTLRDKIEKYRRNFERGFGRDRLNHLQLLVDLKIILENQKPRRGLLAS
jgi:hypothetical protein